MNKFSAPSEEDFLTVCDVLGQMMEKGQMAGVKKSKVFFSGETTFNVTH